MVLSLFVGFFIVWKNKYIYREVNIYLLIVALNITIFYLIVIGSFASDNLEFLHSILGNNILDYFLILFMYAMALFSLLTIIYYWIRFGYKLVKRIFSDFNKFDNYYQTAKNYMSNIRNNCIANGGDKVEPKKRNEFIYRRNNSRTYKK